MRALITGGAGFIGSHLADLLIDEGWEVSVLDNMDTGRLRNVNKKAELHEISVFDYPLMTHLVEQADVVYHLAAVVGYKRVMVDPPNVLQRNIAMAHTVFDVCRIHRKPVLFTSSSEAYGDILSVPQSEDDDIWYSNPMGMNYGYGLSKVAGEYLATYYRQARGLDVGVVRLFNTSGPRQHFEYGMVLPSMVVAALKGEPIIVHGDGAQSRSFCHVHDTVRGLYALMNQDAHMLVARANGGVFNIGATNVTTIKELAQKVKVATESKSKIEFKPHGEVYGGGFQDIKYRRPCVYKAKKMLKWVPEKGLDEIINDTIAYWDEAL